MQFLPMDAISSWVLCYAVQWLVIAWKKTGVIANSSDSEPVPGLGVVHAGSLGHSMETSHR